MKLIAIKKKTCKKASLVLQAFVSAMGMYINLIQGARGGGGGERGLHKRTMGEIIVILRT